MANREQEEAINEYKKTQKIQKKHEDMISTHGWVVHHVTGGFDEHETPNIHTHGLKENFNHTDFQIVAKINPEQSQSILHIIVNQIKSGKTFKDGMICEDILANGYVCKFISVTEDDGRKLLRIIMPDSDGNINHEDIKGSMKIQYDV